MENKRRRSTKPAGTSSSGDSKSKPKRPAGKSGKSPSKTGIAVGTVQVQIAVDDAYIDDFSRIVASGLDLGLDVEQELPEVGIIIGRIPADKVVDLEGVKGIYAVERSRSYRIPPPESDLQ